MDGEASSSGCRVKGAGSKNGGSCFCGVPWIVRTSSTDANPGRRFKRCSLSKVSVDSVFSPFFNFDLNSFPPTPFNFLITKKIQDGGGCNFFEWVDESCERCGEFIPGLLRKINHLEDRLMLYEATEYMGRKEDFRKGPGCDCDHIWLLKNSKIIMICIVVCCIGLSIYFRFLNDVL